MQTADFDFVLPPELIAQAPMPARDQSRLLVLHRDTKKISHRRFRDVLEYLHPGDVLVLEQFARHSRPSARREFKERRTI